MNVLVVAPHPDDESLGCGGAICLHSRSNDRIAAVFLTSGELGLSDLPPMEARGIREAEARRASAILGVDQLHFLRYPDGHLSDHVSEGATALRSILGQCLPELIYLPHLGESHLDHQAAFPIVLAALEKISLSATLRLYEIWTPLIHYDWVENISSVMAKKMRAIRMHRSQLRQLAYDRAISGLNQYRGAFATNRFAEVFQVTNPPAT